MCGRFAITLPNDAMARLFDATLSNDLPGVENYNVCPTNAVASVTSVGGVRRVQPMRWGFVPSWYDTPAAGPLVINARSETIATKPAFREAIRSRRCLIPADGYFEWTKDKDGTRLPWYIRRKNQQPLVFAGLWQEWERDGERLRTCAIVTCAAGPELTAIHHREPVLLAPDAFSLWLGEDGHGAAVLMRPCQPSTMEWFRVARDVNSNRASGPRLICPLED